MPGSENQGVGLAPLKGCHPSLRAYSLKMTIMAIIAIMAILAILAIMAIMP